LLGYFELYSISEILPFLLDVVSAFHGLFAEQDFPGTRLLSTAIQSQDTAQNKRHCFSFVLPNVLQSPFPINFIDHCELTYKQVYKGSFTI